MEGKNSIILGICAMDNKARSKGMLELLHNFISKGQIEIIIFDEQTICYTPIEEWPICNCLIAFYSDGFPLDKAIAYYKLRKPYCINDLIIQKSMLDRRLVYEMLENIDIPTPRHVFLNRDTTTDIILKEKFPPSKWRQSGDGVEVDGVRMDKPFIEKPANAEDHNNHIYYSLKQGGGCRKLFRKINNESSRFFPELNRIREDSSYIYEEFFEEHFVDIKVYTVGQLIYVQQRKSPAVDGVVERGNNGMEVRQQVELTEEEKEMVRKISNTFKQTVCGIDILRSSNHSYICDVNGWSFVKGEPRYYQVASAELYKLMTDYMNRLDDPSSLHLEETVAAIGEKFLDTKITT